MKTPLKFSLYLSLILFCFAAISLSAQSLEVPTTTINFEETEFDFFKVKEGQFVSHTYSFTNTGDEALIIESAKGSCGCTVPSWPKEPIMPGKTGEITVEFNSKSKAGKQNKKITITANTDPAQHFIYMVGTVVETDKTEEPTEEYIEDWSAPIPMEIPPAAPMPPPPPAVPAGPTTEIEFEEVEFNFGEIDEGELISHVYTFTNVGNEPLVLSDAKGSCGCTVPQWPRHPIAPGETASMTVEFNSKNKYGERRQKVTITANTNPPQSFIFLNGTITKNLDEEIEIPTFDFVEEEEEAPESDLNCFAIYPNPTAELLILDMKENIGKSATVTIFSQAGELMARREINEVGGTIEFYVDHYAAGMYIAHVQVGDGAPESRCFVVVD